MKKPIPLELPSQCDFTWPTMPWTLPLFIFVLGCIASVSNFWVLRNQEERTARTVFESRAEEREKSTARQLSTAMGDLYATKAFYAASQVVDRDEFDRFVSQIMRHKTGLHGVAWVPLVEHESRESHERSQQEAVPGYTIKGVASDHGQSSADRPNYFPITYAVSQDEATPLFGLDLGHDSTTRAALDVAVTTGEVSLLPQDVATERRHELDVVLPIYQNGATLTDAVQRREHLRGFLLGTFDWEEIDALAYAELAPGGVDVRYVLHPNSASPHILHNHVSRTRMTSDAPAWKPEKDISRLLSSTELMVGRATLSVQCFASPSLLAEFQTIWPWVSLFGGSLLSLLVAICFRLLICQRGNLETLVRKRTHQIEITQDKLTVEVDERQAAETYAHEQATQLQAILDTAADGIITIDKRGIIQSTNRFIVQTFGYEAAELLGQNVSILLPSPHREQHDGYLVRYLTTGEARIIGRTQELAGRRKDGSLFPLELSVSEVPLAGERLFTGIVRDISDRKAATKALEESETRFQQIAAHLDDLLWMTSGDGLEVLYVSSSYESVFGRNSETLRGDSTDWANAVHPEDRERFARQLYELAPQGLCKETYRIVHPDDSIRWVEGTAFPIQDEAGEVYRLAGTVRDITHSVKTAAELRTAKEAAEQASVAKSQFLASMSHELRTPLNGVIGMTELLTSTSLDGKQRQFVEACRSSGESLLHLINDILDLTKIEAGKLELDAHDFDLEKLVTDTVEMISWRAMEKDLETPCRVDQSTRLIVKGDSDRLRQVLINLLGNAIKFTESGEVAVHTTVVNRQKNRMTVRFEVRDTGIGISEDRRHRLFQSFSQVDSSTTRKYGGTGLGLSISQSLVELMGGTIGVDSEAGVGSTFWFEVLFDVVDVVSDPASCLKQMHGQHVLVVDDNATNRTILAEYTSEWELSCTTTASVDEAIATIDQADACGTPFDLVLTDYHMPQRDGLELAQILKTRNDLPVVLVGSSELNLKSNDLASIGIELALRKPVRRVDLFNAIRQVQGSTKPASDTPDDAPRPEFETFAAHILLAEDNSINLMFVVELMKQLGCTFDTVTNGREATEAVQQANYDLVLMDCQMPEMDGFEATQSIRQMEANGTLDGHLPIVALTANAIKGDRERCLDAGMDDYLTKPVQMQQITNVFAQFLRNADEQLPVDTVAPLGEMDEPAESLPIDTESLLERCFGNVEFAGSLLDELEATGLERVAEIRRQAEQHNAPGTAGLAHALKGATGILCAESLHHLSAEIEQAGRAFELDGIEEMIRDLSTEMHRCLDSLPQLRAEMKVQSGRVD